MRTDLLRKLMPGPLGPVFLAYTAASLTHFVHNAEYLAFYPNMPTWITRQTVYQAWLGVAAVGALGIGLRGMGWPALGAVVLALYGALGLYGLGHYTLALCTEHSLTANLTIWLEVLTGLMLMGVAARVAWRSRSVWTQAPARLQG
jgi:hypothetical protein